MPLKDRTPDNAARKKLKQKELLMAEEAACYIGLTVKGLYDLIKRDHSFKAKAKIYGRVYFKRALLDEWLDE